MHGVLSTRSAARILGEDARTFLQGVITQDVLLHEGPAFSALLTPQGKILFDFILAPTEGGYFIDCDSASADALVKRLSMYKLRAKVTIAAAPELAIAVGAPAGAFCHYADPRATGLPPRAIVARDDSAPSADADYDALRHSLGVPEFGKDFSSEEVFLLDVNYDALNAVSYKKGCFVGQEVTSRMKRKGEIRKRTLIARFDGVAPAKGTPVVAGDQPIGEMLGGATGLGLALIRTDRLAAAQEAAAAIACAGTLLQLSFPDYLERG